MYVEKDYEELLKLLNKHKVKYVIIGAFAFAFHAKPRYTKDIDILVEPSIENAKKIIKAMSEFGFKSLNLCAPDFIKPGQIIQLGYEPVRIDIVTSICGVSFNQIWKNKVTGKYGRQKVFFIGLKELMKNKKQTGRKQDEADLEGLKNLRK